MKKIFLLLFSLMFILPSSARSVWINDLRTLFLDNGAIIYAINIRTFNAKDLNGNGIIDKGEESGNFINAIERLDELQGLGVNTIHLLPVTKTGKIKALGNAGSLYAMSSFNELNPQFDEPKNRYSVYQEAKLFVSEAHRRNIRVMVDLPSCGAYDLFLSNPELFIKDKEGNSKIASDWTDVRIFKVKNQDGTLNQELLNKHKEFIDLMLSLDIDGVRADVAAIKPYEFWKELIDYTRKKSPQFLFLAEASPLWDNPAPGIVDYTPVNGLLKAGFDAHYGKLVNFENVKKADDFFALADFVKKPSKKEKNYQSSIIGSFATHDITSPMLKGGVPYSRLLIWLNCTLPLNPYFVDGFLTGDKYIYPYSNKKAQYSATDDDLYFTHSGKLDIFNFSSRPGGDENEILSEYQTALRFKNWAKNILKDGKFVRLRANDERVIGYEILQGEDAIIIMANPDFKNSIRTDVKVPNIKESSFVVPVKFVNPPKIKNGKIQTKLEPYELQVLLLSKMKSE